MVKSRIIGILAILFALLIGTIHIWTWLAGDASNSTLATLFAISGIICSVVGLLGLIILISTWNMNDMN